MFSLNASKVKLLSDAIPVDDSRIDPQSRAGLDRKNLIIRCSGGPSLRNAVDQYMANANSIHLLIERDGQEMAQMVDLDRIAIHANEFNQDSLGIELAYPGYLLESPGTWKSKDRYDPFEMIYAKSVNDVRERWWPMHSQGQLDTLLEIVKLLESEFKLERVMLRYEVNPFDLNSGPAFPANRLRQLLAGEGSASELLEETAEEVDLFVKPGENNLKILEERVPAGTPIVATNENEDGSWVLVEVMADLGDRRWTVGWMRADKIAAKPFVPKVNANHMLVTSDNRRIRYVAAHRDNFNPTREIVPRFVVIHFTTGTNPLSTVHTFMDPEEGVSTHLLVGRTGRVVQFVPFDRMAYHCGHSTWEGERDLNRFSIGIEVDNAGYLRTTSQGFKRKSKLIPEDQVRHKAHWKDNTHVRPWQTFTDTQVEVVTSIVKALKEKYPTIQEIVGHDMVNMINRYDPGPFYPLGELREAIIGDPQPVIKHYSITADCSIYENIEYRPPNVPHPEFGELPKNSRVRVREVQEKWTKVIVKLSSDSHMREKIGWVRSDSLDDDGNRKKTKFAQTFYQVIPASRARLPGIELDIGQLPKDTRVRVQLKVGDEWALVSPVLQVRKDADGRYEMIVPQEQVPKFFREGWVKQEFLKEADSA